jgi:GntR family transcriptional regulator, rspAB operon transcriptional repressor
MSTRIAAVTQGSSKRPRKSPANPLGKSPAHAPGGSSESKVDQIYGALKLAIVSGELPPEAPIDKIDLCARFGVSRLSVTTAVNRLAFERLVVVEPQRGSYVSRIRSSDVRQWMLVRRALEVEVVGACAQHLGDDWIAQLDRNMAYQRTAVKSGDLDGFYQLDIAFHRLLIEGLARTHLDRVLRELEVFQERHPNFFTD